MEALVPRIAILAAAFVSLGASHRTTNFIVTASNQHLAVEIANAAEKFRSDLAMQWLGKELPRWAAPCPIRTHVGPQLPAGGETSFMFETQPRGYGQTPSGDGLFQAMPRGRPFGWKMFVQGSRQRVLDSVLPHEVTHTIFATYFGRALPRWIDEGACTTVEHSSEREKQHRLLYEFLRNDRGIAFNDMFAMKEYPRDMLPLYSQGYSLARFLIAQGGHRKFIRYVDDGLDSNDWTAATGDHYGFDTLSDLQVTWLDWVSNGSPNIPLLAQTAQQQVPVQLASNGIQNRDPLQSSSPIRSNTARSQLTRTAGPEQIASGSSWYASHRQNTPVKVASQHQRQPQHQPQPQPRSRLTGQPDFLPDVSDPGANVATATATVPTASRLVAVPPPTTEQKAARPNDVAPQRDVIIEWGQPTPALPKVAAAIGTAGTAGTARR